MRSLPKLIVVMGVSGCGKSTIACALAEYYKYEFVEADDFHCEQNKQWMSSGRPLTDSMRAPWIDLLRSHLGRAAADNRSCVMSFSGLRREHRAQMRALPFDLRFLFLQGSKELIGERISARKGHFVGAALLDSQFAALQNPFDSQAQSEDPEEDVISICIDQSLEEVIEASKQALACC